MSLQKHDQDESMMTIANNTNSNHTEKPKMLVMSWQLTASFFQVTLWTHSWTINPWPKSFITRDIIQHVQFPPKKYPKQSAGFIHGTFTNKRNNCLCNQRIIEGIGDRTWIDRVSTEISQLPTGICCKTNFLSLWQPMTRQPAAFLGLFFLGGEKKKVKVKLCRPRI